MDAQWIVARTQANRERWAAENVARLDHEYYLPMYCPESSKVITPSKFDPPKLKPIFSRYLFVHIVGSWRFLLGTFGVAGIVMNGSKPGILPNDVIADLKNRECKDGFIMLPSKSEHRFTPGQKLRVKDGAFSGFVGLHEGSKPHEREQILLDLLGQKVIVLIATGDLEKV